VAAIRDWNVITEQTDGRAETGVDVIITIFCDFGQFSPTKFAFFSKNQCYDQIFA
jgi:hypothetical protein